MDLPVNDSQWMAAHGRWRGRVVFPGRRHPVDILIFSCGTGFAGVRARCPHEGQNLSETPLDADGVLVCPRHGLPVRVSGPGAAGFRVERRADGFCVPWPLLPSAQP